MKHHQVTAVMAVRPLVHPRQPTALVSTAVVIAAAETVVVAVAIEGWAPGAAGTDTSLALAEFVRV